MPYMHCGVMPYLRSHDEGALVKFQLRTRASFLMDRAYLYDRDFGGSRLCRVCDMGVVEDAEHFSFYCSLYQGELETLWGRLGHFMTIEMIRCLIQLPVFERLAAFLGDLKENVFGPVSVQDAASINRQYRVETNIYYKTIMRKRRHTMSRLRFALRSNPPSQGAPLIASVNA